MIHDLKNNLLVLVCILSLEYYEKSQLEIEGIFLYSKLQAKHIW